MRPSSEMRSAMPVAKSVIFVVVVASVVSAVSVGTGTFNKNCSLVMRFWMFSAFRSSSKACGVCRFKNEKDQSKTTNQSL